MNKYFKVMGLALVASAPVFGAAGFDEVVLASEVFNCFTYSKATTEKDCDFWLYPDNMPAILKSLSDAGSYVLDRNLPAAENIDSIVTGIVQKNFRARNVCNPALAVIADKLSGKGGDKQFHIMVGFRGFLCIDEKRDNARGLLVRTTCLGFPSLPQILRTGRIGMALGYEYGRFYEYGRPCGRPLVPSQEWSAYVGRAIARCTSCIKVDEPLAVQYGQQVRDLLEAPFVGEYLTRVAGQEFWKRSPDEPGRLISIKFS